MKREPEPVEEWWPTDQHAAVTQYRDEHYEFEVDWETGRPYGNRLSSELFVRRSRPKAWKLRSSRIGSSLTADLLATVDLLGLPTSSQRDPGSPAGHAEGGRWWLPFLDGGLFVEFTQTEHQTTNRVSATQRVWVLGANAFRHLMESLEIAPPAKRGPGDPPSLTPADRRALLAQQATPGTTEHAEVQASARRWPSLPED